MLCPACNHDNIDGSDSCERCGSALVQSEGIGSALEQSISRHAIAVLSPKDPVTVAESATVREGISRLHSQEIGCLLVERDGALSGIFTERDVLEKISADLSTLDEPIGKFMTPGPTTISGDDSIAYALQQMVVGDYRHLPIVDDRQHPSGIISVRDILRFLCVRFAQLRP